MLVNYLKQVNGIVQASIRESIISFWVMVKITIPIIVAIRLIESFIPIVQYLGLVLDPVMSLIGLPGEIGVAWAAAILIQPLPAFAIVAERWNEFNLTIAQATIFGLLVLEVHAIFVEGRIAQLLGVRLWVTCVLRFGFAILLAAILDWFYKYFDILQQPATLFLLEPIKTDASWGQWIIFQVQSWTFFFLLLFGLIFLMKIIRILHIEKVLIYLLRPFLNFMGIHKSAGVVAVLGLILGLTFGAALIMNEHKSGKIPPKDLFLMVSLLGICHSLLDDTLLTMVFGAHISGILFARLIFAMIVISIFARILNYVPDNVVDKWFMTHHMKVPATVKI